MGASKKGSLGLSRVEYFALFFAKQKKGLIEIRHGFLQSSALCLFLAARDCFWTIGMQALMIPGSSCRF